MSSAEVLASIDWPSFFINLIVLEVGILAHFFKKCYKDEIPLRDYWLAHKQSSIMAVAAAHGSYFALVVGAPEQLTIVAVFSIGWVLDSAVNKHQ